jgi:hypothetical protein
MKTDINQMNDNLNKTTFQNALLWTYRYMDILSPWMFEQKDVLAWGHFGTRNFRHHGRFAMEYFNT